MKVSVHMPVYNHEAYLAEALDSALMQQTEFPFEIVVGEDCSTDGSRRVARQYAERYPDRITLLLHERNLGIYDNNEAIVEACRGEYIAWLEGDDYWTTADKLQKQVAFLDRHPDHSACFHWAQRLDETDGPVTWQHGPPVRKPHYTVDDFLLHGHFAPSCTVVFRADLARTPSPWTRATNFLETTYLLQFALAGKVGFLDEHMAVFRYHGGGIYGRADAVGNIQTAIDTHRLIGRHLPVRTSRGYRKGLATRYRQLSHELLRSRHPVRALAAGIRSLCPR